MIWPEITFLRPVWLLALPGLAAFGWMLWRRSGSLGAWKTAMDPHLFAALQALGRVDPGIKSRDLTAGLLALVLAALALSGPAVARRDAVSFRNLDAVVFVIDLSPSMTADPGAPAMLTAARFAIEALGARPAALVVYAGDAYLASDLTLDHHETGQTLSLLDGDTVPDPGSRPERSLRLAAEVLRSGQILSGDVILFTDGAGLPTALPEAATLAAQNARLSVLITRPDAAAHAQTLAQAGGGQVFGPGDTAVLVDYVRDGSRAQLQRNDYPLLLWFDLGRYVLLAALVPLALMIRRERLT